MTFVFSCVLFSSKKTCVTQIEGDNKAKKKREMTKVGREKQANNN